MHRAVCEEVAAQTLGWDISFTHIGAFGGGETLGVSARRQNPVKINFPYFFLLFLLLVRKFRVRWRQVRCDDWVWSFVLV